ncbi:hypothetical protein DFJ74DRAFT_760337 [Hyaloraphidium curvatum]|nr:hypothetical protein DFJ74DRAFT_760337 [Hyaloraphidium curvatum]
MGALSKHVAAQQNAAPLAPPPPYSATGGMVGAGYAAPYGGDIISNLRRIVTEQKLQAFYDENRLQRVAADLAQRIGYNANRIQTGGLHPGFRGEIDELDEVAAFSILGLYDIVLFVDDSGSIEAAEAQDGRKTDMVNILEMVCALVCLYDDDGISVRPFSNKVEMDNVKTASDVMAFFKKLSFNFSTPMGEKLESRVLKPMVVKPAQNGKLPKPVLVITITDGIPDSETDVFNAIKRAKADLAKTRYGAGAVAFQFAQVGGDRGAQDFLSRLDNDSAVGAMIDCTSQYEMEQEEWASKGRELGPGMYMLKLLTGAIDPAMDGLDE